MEKRNHMMKPKIRAPMQEVILPDFPDDDNTVTTTVTKSRRVSFGTNFVKEFIVGSAVSAQCVSEYEQAFSSSDSSNPNSSYSGVESGILNQNTFVLEESHKSNIMPPPELEDSRSVKRPKISSTICFSVDSPTADMEFTEGCISLAKSILDKKNKEMKVIIQAKSKDSKEEKKVNKEEESKYFEGSQGDMSFVKSFCGKESKKEEKIFEGEKTVVFSTFEDEMSFTYADKIENFVTTPTFLGGDETDESWEEESKVNKMPLNLIIHHLDRDNSDLESSLFHPQVSLSDVLKSNSHNNSNESEKLNLSESSIFKMPQMDSPGMSEDDIVEKLPRLSSTDEMVEQIMNCNEDATPLKEPTITTGGLAEKEEDSFLETLHTGVDIEGNKESFEEVNMDVTLAKEVISEITLSKIVPPAEGVHSFIKDPNLDDKTVPNILSALIQDPTNNNMVMDGENIVEVLNQLDDENNEESRIVSSQSTGNVPQNLCKKKEIGEDVQVTATEEILRIVAGEQKSNEISESNDDCKSTEVGESREENELLEVKERTNEVKEVEVNISSQGSVPEETINKIQEIEWGNISEAHEKSANQITSQNENSASTEKENLQKNTNEKPKESKEELNKNVTFDNEGFDMTVEQMCSLKENDGKNTEEVSCLSEVLKKNESLVGFENNETINAEKSIQMEIENQVEVQEVVKDKKVEDSCFTENEEEEFINEKVVEESLNKNIEPQGMDLTEVAQNSFIPVENIEAMEVDDEREGSMLQQSVNESDVSKHEVKETSLEEDTEKEQAESPPRYKEPSLVDRKVIENLKEQSEEPGCIWALEEVEYPQHKIKGSLSCSFNVLESKISFKFYLESSDEDTLGCSFVCGGETSLSSDGQLKVPDYWQVLNFGFEKLKQKFEGELKNVKTIRQVPYFLDQMNLFTAKINSYLRQIYSVLTLYPGSTLEGSKLSFRLFSFPILFSCTVSLDLQDFTRLSRSSASFHMDFGDLDKNKISEILEECSQRDNTICEFIIRSTDYIVGLERKTGYRSKRHYIGLLPKHLTG